MPQCIRTGADVLVVGDDLMVHGDLYDLGDYYILTLSKSLPECMWAAPRYNLAVHHYSVIGSRALAFSKLGDCSSAFSYEGEPSPLKD